MKKKTKNKIIKSSVVGALGAAAAGGVTYLLSNKKTRKKINAVIKNIEKRGGEEIDKVLNSVSVAKKKSEKKIAKKLKSIKSKTK